MIKRILILATYFPDPNHPSRGNWSLEQAIEFLKQGYDVQVIVPTPWVPPGAALFSPKLRQLRDVPLRHPYGDLVVHYLRWPYYPWHSVQHLNRTFPDSILRFAWTFMKRQCMSVIAAFKPDCVLAYHTLVCGHVAYLVNRECGLPYVVTDQEVGDLLACAKDPKIRRLFLKVNSRAVRMVGCSQTMEKAGRSSVPEIPFSTIYNGSSFPCAPVERPDTGERTTILCCAKFYGRKDIPLLIRACDALLEKGLKITLRIGGDGPDREIVDACLREARHPDHLKLLGLLTPGEVRDEMLKADIFALVGWAEPFGVVFLEAMACGLPIVVSEDAGVSEALEDGKSAMFTKPRDQESVERAIARLVEDPALRRKVAERGQKVYEEQLTWKSINRQFVDLFEKNDRPREG